ncbi:50S ribosomal protein L9 [Candidatus Kaiserbacteria bacterium]|nr:50S ribosomal protein L9 [Candidatus Kaiserbacteria bacterium]
MKVILLEDLKKVGQRGTVAIVADGYANNVLIPKKLAVPATGENLKRHDKEKQAREGKAALDATLAKKLLSEIDGKNVSIQARANPNGGLFEAIHPRQVAEAIRKELNVSIPEEAITLPETIKKLGEFRAEIVLQGVSAEVVVLISKI